MAERNRSPAPWNNPLLPLFRRLEPYARGLDPAEVDLQWIIQSMRPFTPRSSSGPTEAEQRKFLELCEKHRGDIFAVFGEYLREPDVTGAPGWLQPQG
jgi:hypothetical protein